MSIELELEILGYMAAFMTTSAFFPQAYKVYQTKHTADLSIGLFGLLSGGILLWFFYGLIITSYPLIIANFISFIFAFYIFFMKLKLDIFAKKDDVSDA